MKVKVAQSSNSLWPHGLYSPWNSPGQNTGVGSLSLLQGTIPMQRLNPDSLPAEPPGKPNWGSWDKTAVCQNNAIYSLAPKTVVWVPTALMSPGSLLEMQNLRPFPRPLESDSLILTSWGDSSDPEVWGAQVQRTFQHDSEQIGNQETMGGRKNSEQVVVGILFVMTPEYTAFHPGNERGEMLQGFDWSIWSCHILTIFELRKQWPDRARDSNWAASETQR